jgi:3-oxoacyl-[acyl-carrier-protein] synthase-1
MSALICGIGVTTSVGADSAQSCAAMRAGIQRFTASELHLCRPQDPEGDLEPATVAAVRGPSDLGTSRSRSVSLTLPALADAVLDARLRRAEMGRASVFVASEGSAPPDFVSELFRRAGAPGPAVCTVTSTGHAALAEALEGAMKALAAGAEAALVVSFHAPLEPETLARLDERDRLKCSRSPEGIVPGEAAAVLVLRRAADGVAPARARIAAVGRAQEAHTILGDEACTGTGMCAAVRGAAAALPPASGESWVILDHTGERYRALEWAYVVARMHRVFGALRHTWYLADTVGDCGAAAGGLAAARACWAWQRGHAPSRRAWILLGSESGQRGAIVLEAPEGG